MALKVSAAAGFPTMPVVLLQNDGLLYPLDLVFIICFFMMFCTVCDGGRVITRDDLFSYKSRQ